MTLRISKAAEADLDDAMAFYRLQRSGLEMEFLAELEAAFKRIADYPLAWHPMSPSTRRCRLNRFPYGVIYRIKSADDIQIIAIAHSRRKPRLY
jgi:plasmid stabilization system protein ParE